MRWVMPLLAAAVAIGWHVTTREFLSPSSTHDERVFKFLNLATSVDFQLDALAGPAGVALRASFESFRRHGAGNAPLDWTEVACAVLDPASPRRCIETLLRPADANISDQVDRLVGFMRHLASSTPLPQRSSQSASPPSRVVVAGGGPAGLVAGLAAVQAGCPVAIIERRFAYNRDVWFDLAGSGRSSKPTHGVFEDGVGGVGPTQAVLDGLGFSFQKAQVVRYEDTENEQGRDRDVASSIVTVKCSELETFLAKVLFLAGATVIFGARAIEPCGDKIWVSLEAGWWATGPSSEAILLGSDELGIDEEDITCESLIVDLRAVGHGMHGNDSELFVVGALVFDILVVADGAKSALRQRLKIPLVPVKSFVVRPAESLSPSATRGASSTSIEVKISPELAYNTVILRFQPDPINGACPRLRGAHETNDGGESEAEASPLVTDPFAVAGLFPGEVTSAFKRFFYGHCEVQIGLRHGYKHSYFDAVGKTGIPAGGASDGDLHNAASSSLGYDSAQSSIPWDLLGRVLTSTFAENELLCDERSIRHRLVPCAVLAPADSNISSGLCGATFLSIPIQHVASSVVTLPDKKTELRTRDGKGGAVASTKRAIIVGDAAATALYRLGVGVNVAFAGLAELRRALHASAPGSLNVTRHHNLAGLWKESAAWERLSRSLDTRLEALAAHQAAAVFWEATCGLIVHRDELWRPISNLSLLMHGGKDFVSYEGPLSPAVAIRACGNSSAVPPWSWEAR